MKTKVLFIAAILTLSSCSYFRVIPENPEILQSNWQYEESGKILILHRGDNAWHFYDVRIIEDTLHATLDVQLGYLVNYLDPEVEDLNIFNKSSEPEVVNTMHFYTSDTSFSMLDTNIAIPLSSVYEVRSYEYARAPSRASKIVPIVVLPIVGLVTISLIAISQMEFNITAY